MIDYSPLIKTPLLAFVVAIFLHTLALKLFPRFGLLDFPERYGLTRKRLPYPVGILSFVTFAVFFPLLFGLGMQSWGILTAIALVAIVSFIDDRTPLPSYLRLGIQATAAALIFLTGDCIGGRVCSVTNPLESFVGGPIIELNGAFPILSIFVTVFWLMLTTNALNWFDGIPGQASTISTIGFLTIGFLSLSSRVNQPELALAAFVLAGIAFASFLFTLPPPLAILGDSGSMFFGFMLGILTIIAGGKIATAFLVLGIPIIDLLFVIIRRITNGRSPFVGSMSGEHLHHRLLACGWSPLHIIMLTAGIGTAFGVTALFLDTVQKFIAALLLTLLMLLLGYYSGRGNAAR